MIKYGHHAYSCPSDLMGGFAGHCLLVSGTKIMQLPASMPLEVACPISCATATITSAMETAKSIQGETVIVFGEVPDARLGKSFLEDNQDHRILSVALMLQQRETQRPVILVSKDTNLRLKAKSLGLTAQDYNNDKVESFDKLYTGKRLVKDLPSTIFAHFSENGGQVPANLLPDILDPIANENFILRITRAQCS